MSQPLPIATALLDIDKAALAQAKRWGLIDDQGQLWCIKECGRLGQLPSLCCPTCLEGVRRGWR